jgi:hypothetical protein
MLHTCRKLLYSLSIALSFAAAPAPASDLPQLPTWEMLEYEEQAFWATAKSRLEIPRPETGESTWSLLAESSVPGNFEQLTIRFEPATGQLLERQRLSQGNKDRRLKSFEYFEDHVLRRRQAPGEVAEAPPAEWPVTSSKRLDYPPEPADAVITDPYMLLLLAGRLQAQGPGATMEAVVHTDFNFYRVRMTCGNGVPVKADYTETTGGRVSGTRKTVGVVLRVSPAGELAERDDFTLLGLSGDIILLFDMETGLPLQVRGLAPRIGSTEIDLKSVTLRNPAS